MVLNYNYAESTVEPAELEIIKNDVYLRKNITSEERTSEQSEETVTMYTYQECHLSKEEYSEYLAETQAISLQTIMQAITELQVSVDEL